MYLLGLVGARAAPAPTLRHLQLLAADAFRGEYHAGIADPSAPDGAVWEMSQMEKTWASGALELLRHAYSHIEGDSAFDKRMAFISIDNCVEVNIADVEPSYHDRRK